MYTVLATVLLLAVGLTAAVEHDTVMCYGNRFKTLVGGSTESTDINLDDCPSCKEAQLCPQGTNICFSLAAGYVYVFEGGYALQPPIALSQECQPLRLIEVDPGYEYSVQCASTPSQYNPRRQHIFRPDEESYFNTDGVIIEENSVQTLASFPDNNVLIIDKYFALYIVSFLAKSDTVLVLYDVHYPVPIPECNIITRLTAGPVIDSNLQLIVDCNTTDGTIARKRVLIADNLRTSPSVVSLPGTHLLNDVVSFSPDGDYILSVSITQLTIAQVNELTSVPGILHFNGPIAQTIFITNYILLVSVPGEEREIIDIPRLFSSSFEEGQYVLPESVAVCSMGECPPAVYRNGTLFLFSADRSYQLLSAYDVNNPSASPKRINRVLKPGDVCYPVTADILVIDPPIPLSTIDGINSSIYDGIEPQSRKPFLTEGGIAGIVISGIVIVVAIVVLISVFIFKRITIWKPKQSSRVAQATQPAQPSSNQLPLPNPSLLNPPPTRLDTPSIAMSTAWTSLNASSTTSSRSVTPMSETVINHKDVPLSSRNTQQQVPPKP